MYDKEKKYLKCHEYDYLSCKTFESVERKKGKNNYYSKIDWETFNCLWELIESENWDQDIKYEAGGKARDKLFLLNKNGNFKEWIQVRAFVGILKLKNGVIIEILPKIPLDIEFDFQGTPEAKEQLQERKTRYKLAEMFAESDPKVKQLIKNADYGTFDLPLTEAGIRLYLSLISDLTSKGIKSGYIFVAENSNCFKGRPNLRNQFKFNIVHKERCFVDTDEFSENTPMNRLIKKALEKISQSSDDSENKKKAHQLLRYFKNVQATNNSQSDYDNRTPGRDFSYYDTAVKWSYAILQDKNYDIFFLGKNKNRSFLLPMPDLYENYVALKLEPKCRMKGWTFNSQDKRKHLFDIGPDNQEWQQIIPDIYIDAYGHPVLLDTKWKVLQDYQKKKYDSVQLRFNIDRDDLYQMVTYGVRYQASDIWLLYPRSESQPKNLPLKFESHNKNWPNINIHVFAIDLMKIDESMNQLVADIEREIRSH